MASILIIDDEETLCEMLKLLLEEEGYAVTAVTNGDEAVKAYRKKPYDLIVTDIFMPVKDGIETILELKEDHPDLKIIAISGGGSAGIGVRDALIAAEEFGANHTFHKPISRSEFLKAVHELLGE